jgi:hypothetical protein
LVTFCHCLTRKASSSPSTAGAVTRSRRTSWDAQQTKRSGSETSTPFGSKNADAVLPRQSGEKSETIWRESAVSASRRFAEVMHAREGSQKRKRRHLRAPLCPRSVPLSPQSAIVIS